MAIDFKSSFGGSSARAATQADDRPKAELWLNIGYEVTVPMVVDGKNVDETRFVSLPTGIPLDTMDKVSARTSNDTFAAFQTARNDLLDQIMKAAEELAPGEEKLLNLQIQLRRVNGERAEIASEENPFVQQLQL